MAFTIASALRWWSLEQPDQLALSVDDEPCTFGELYAWSARVGRYLQGLGVQPGDRVGVVAPNSMDYALLAFGLMRIGAIGAPLNFRSTATEIHDAFADLTPVLAFGDAERAGTLREALGPEAAARLRSLEEIRALRHGEAAPLDVAIDADAPVFIIGTSGSTARPKGVIYTQRMIMTYASEFAIMEPRCARGSRILSLGPFSSSSGYLLLMQFSALGVTLYIESQFRPERALRLLADKKITTMQGAPIFFERIAAAEGFREADLSSLYWAQVGGAPVKPALLTTWLDKGVTLRQLYGSTEAGGGWGARDDTALSAPEKCGRGGVFTEYAIRDEGSGFAPPGVAGEILVRSPCMTVGYWNNPEASRTALAGGWLHTGDLGVIDERGALTFVDRLKDIIISGGLNVSAAELERVIYELDGVAEVAVIAVADPDFGETPLAVVHGDPGKLSAEAVAAHCTRHLARFKLPRYVDIASEPLPRLLSGKIAKPALRERYHDAPARLRKVKLGEPRAPERSGALVSRTRFWNLSAPPDNRAKGIAGDRRAAGRDPAWGRFRDGARVRWHARR